MNINTKFNDVCGHVIDLHHDDKINKLNFELVRMTDKYENFDDDHNYLIKIQDWTKKGKTLVTLHLKDAIRIKSVIDSLIYDALKDEIECKQVK